MSIYGDDQKQPSKGLQNENSGSHSNSRRDLDAHIEDLYKEDDQQLYTQVTGKSRNKNQVGITLTAQSKDIGLVDDADNNWQLNDPKLTPIGNGLEATIDMNTISPTNQQNPNMNIQEYSNLKTYQYVGSNQIERRIAGVINDAVRKRRAEIRAKFRERMNISLAVPMEGAAFYFKEHGRRFVIYDKRSLGICKAEWRIRRMFVWLKSWPAFDNFVLCVILINALFMGAYDYADREGETDWNRFAARGEQVFTVLFVVEFLIKVIAMGFVLHRNSYLRDPWNWLDFTVVCTGISEFFTEGAATGITALRALRVLRPLRAANAYPSLKRLIGTLLSSLPRLANVVVFILFIFFLFGIWGVTLFRGALYQRCRTEEKPFPLTGPDAKWPAAGERLCSKPGGAGLHQCPGGQYCGGPQDFGLPRSIDDVQNSELISYGIVHFDNIAVAVVTIFQMITLEGWTGLMYDLQDAGPAWFAVIYCILVVIIGSFFLLNVILAVISDSLDSAGEDMTKAEKIKNKQLRELKVMYGIDDSEDEVSDLEDNDDGPQKSEGIPAKSPPLFINQQAALNAFNGPTFNRNTVQPFQRDTAVNEVQPESIERSNSVEGSDKSIEAMLKNKDMGNTMVPRGDSVIIRQESHFEDPQDANGNETPKKQVIELNTTVSKQLPKHLKRPKPRMMAELPERAKENRIYRAFFQICTHDLFTTIITLCILVNTIVLAMDGYPIKRERLELLDQLNEVFTYIFLVEMITKLIGLGFKDYAADGFNVFDAVIVVISVVELFLSQGNVEFSSNGAISVFRAVRLLRVFKLARSWTSFRDILEKMLVTAREIRTFAILLLIFILVFALLGMELYGHRVRFNDTSKSFVVQKNQVGFSPRINFNDLLNAIVSIFIIFIGEDWNSVMYDHVRATGDASIVFFCFIFIFGNLVLLNLFLAILVKNFEPTHDEAEKDQLEDSPELSLSQKIKINTIGRISKLFDRFKKKTVRHTEDDQDMVEMEQDINEKISQSLKAKFSNRIEENRISPNKTPAKRSSHNQEQYDEDIDNLMDQKVSSMKKQQSNDHTATQYVQKKSMYYTNAQDLAHAENLISSTSPKTKVLQRTLKMQSNVKTTFTLGQIKLMEQEQSRATLKKHIPLDGNSLFLFHRDNYIRIIASKIVGHQYFDNTILLLIIISTILLALEKPDDLEGTQQVLILQAIDIVMTCAFALEMLIKIVVYGFAFNGDLSYIRDPWNILDFLIVTVSVLSLSLSNMGQLRSLKALRMFRVLRPLRMISRNPGLRIAIQSLLNAAVPIANVFIVNLLCNFLFSILGTNFFKGQFFKCERSNIPEQYWGEIKNAFDCQDLGGEWINQDQNFDNVINDSFVTLTNVMSTEGWIGVMLDAVDSAGINQEPQPENKRLSVFYFMLFIIFGHLFVLNMFVGVVVGCFIQEKEDLELNHLLTPWQSDWCNVMIYLYKRKPLIVYTSSTSKVKDYCYAIASSWYFESFIFICIILNTVCLGLTWYNEPDGLSDILDICSTIFNIIYTIEAIIKIVAFGWAYFADGWNNFDFTIVLVAWFGQISVAAGSEAGTLATVVTILRIMRVFKIVRKNKSLNVLFFTMVGAVPQLTNVGGLLFLFLFLYSVLGVSLFGAVKHHGALTEHANFSRWSTAFLTLIRMSTGESWHELMYACARPRSIVHECEEDQSVESLRANGPQGCGAGPVAYFYFISFTYLVSFIFLNLFIAIILESFDTSQAEEGLKTGAETISKFQEFWAKFDPRGSGFLPVRKLRRLISLILDEEIRQVYRLKQAVKSGAVDVVEAESRIFMFNLHKNADLLPLAGLRKDKIFKEMEDGRQSSPIIETNYESSEQGVSPDGQAEQHQISSSSDSESDHGFCENEQLPQHLRKPRAQREMRRRLMNDFLSSLRIPVYAGVKYYYYHDVLEALARCLFQNLLLQAHVEVEEEDKEKEAAETNKDDDKDSQELAQQETEVLAKAVALDRGSVEEESLQGVKSGDLELVLMKLERKSRVRNIFKCKEMQKLRAGVNKKVPARLDQVGARNHVIDSSQVQAGLRIIRFVEKWRKRRARTQAGQTAGEQKVGNNQKQYKSKANDQSGSARNKSIKPLPSIQENSKEDHDQDELERRTARQLDRRDKPAEHMLPDLFSGVDDQSARAGRPSPEAKEKIIIDSNTPVDDLEFLAFQQQDQLRTSQASPDEAK